MRIIKLLILVFACSSIATSFAADNTIPKFWQWFSSKEAEYYKLNPQNQKTADPAMQQLYSQLQNVDETLTFELGPIDKQGKRELVITADGNQSGFDAVRDTVKQAPKLKKWKITAFRTPKGCFDVTIGGQQLATKNLQFSYTQTESKLDIALYLKNQKWNEALRNGVFIILDNLLGEDKTETKIGIIDYETKPNKHVKLKSICELPTVLAKLKK